MGIIFSVVCDDCKIKRDLDKLYVLMHAGPKDRKEAREYRRKIEDDSFRVGLLVGFMGEHRGHKCRVLSDTDWNEDCEDYIDETEQFWTLDPNEQPTSGILKLRKWIELNVACTCSRRGCKCGRCRRPWVCEPCAKCKLVNTWGGKVSEHPDLRRNHGN
jgi:hypothetical protein